MDGVVKVEVFGQGGKVGGVVVHVVPIAGLGGPTVPSPVMGDDPVATVEKEDHLAVPVVGRERPAVTEHDGLSGSPVLVVDLGAVCRGDGAHGSLRWIAVSAASTSGAWWTRRCATELTTVCWAAPFAVRHP